jgi:large subunit ribosomal protein L4
MKAIQPRDYSYRLPRKAIRAATRMALAAKIIDQQVLVIDKLTFAEPKTKEMVALLKALGLAGKSTLVATEDHNINVYKSARNIEKLEVSPVAGLNALSVLTPGKVIVTKAAMDRILGRGSASVAS